MSTKRKKTGSISDELRYAKRARPTSEDGDSDNGPSTTSNSCEKPRNDPIYGQKNAFPGLDGPGRDEISYGPPEDGIEYLRMVRSEANTLPHLFLASKSSAQEEEPAQNGKNGIEVETSEREGFFIDGVYIARSTTNDIPPAQTTNYPETDPDPQESYYNLLQHRFLLLRSTLKCTPPSSTIAALDTSHPITFPPNSKKAKSEWRRLLQFTDPQMAQLACMSVDSVLALIGILMRLLSEVIRAGEARKVRSLGAWAWGLLGRCRDISELGSSEVGEIRDLGKRAAKVLDKIRENQRAMEEQQEEGFNNREEQSEIEAEEGDTEMTGDVEGEKTGPATEVTVEPEEVLSVQAEITHTNGDEVSDELEAAKARLQAKITTDDGSAPVAAPSISTDEGEVVEEDIDEPAETRKQARAMLDMIITIVGEFYGQRDLLESRDLWEEDLEEWS